MSDWEDFDGIENDWSENLPPDFDDLPEPIYLGRADLLPGGELFADVYADTPSGDYGRDHISFGELEDLLGIDRDDDTPETWADHADDLPFNFDPDDPDIRGPFPDEESVNNFINETGMYWADVYYDTAHDEYFINVTSG